VDKFYIDAVVNMAKEGGGGMLTREKICEALEVAPGSFAHKMGVSYSDFIEELGEALPLDIDMSALVGRRLSPVLRKRQILGCAVKLAEERGYYRVTRKLLAHAAGISEASVAQHFTMPQLREAIVKHAISTKHAAILAQAGSVSDPLLDQ
jgi:hypothetical protein